MMAGVAATAAVAAIDPLTAQRAAPPLTSDIGALKRVLVHSFKASDHQVDIRGSDVLPMAESDPVVAEAQHAGLIALLKATGSDVVEVSDALDSAIAVTRGSGVFDAWLEVAFPRLAANPSRVTGAMLLGRDPMVQYALGPDGSYRHGASDTRSTMWTRDSAFMTPRGLVICNSVSERRRRENMLLRFLYGHSPMLRDVPIAFDAVEEGIIVEGGDAMVVDANTLFLGTGNRSDPRIAPVLAKRLNMDVLTVQTVKRDFLGTGVPGKRPPAAELKLLLLHLDTYFTLVAPKHALTVPYLLEAEFAESSPLVRYIRGARADTRLDAEEAEAALKMLKEFGEVTLYKRGTGKAEKIEGKLVDHLKRLGWRFTWVGGARPREEADAFRNFMRVSYPELRRQAANVVQATPGRVLAYDGNPATRAALEADGIGVDAFPARELWAWHGGPHCLTQPLLRA
jgi:N-dimethylarginine dimethylaminohydrolase